MPPTNLPLTSREFKLPLDTTRFRDADAADFVALVDFTIGEAGGDLTSQKDLKKDPVEKRRTWFLDTPENGFRAHGWILRVRREKADDFTLTLKFRGPDRYVASAQDVAPAAGTADSESKFEADVLPPYACMYSRSTSIKHLASAAPGTVGQVAAFFPVLGTLGMPLDTAVVIADGFVAHETALRIGGFRFGDGPKMKMTVTFWYAQEAMTGYPMLAEFSFDYEATLDGGSVEDFPLATAAGGDTVFRRLQAQGGWLDAAGTTKSALATGGP
jgi:hypothetical protein